MSIILLKKYKEHLSVHSLPISTFSSLFLNSAQIILNDPFLSTSKQRFSLVKSLLAGSLMLNKVLMFLSTLTGCTLLRISILCKDVKGLHITGYLSKATAGQLKQQ